MSSEEKEPQNFMSLFIIGGITTCLFTSYSKLKQKYVPQSKLFSYMILSGVLGYLKKIFANTSSIFLFVLSYVLHFHPSSEVTF